MLKREVRELMRVATKLAQSPINGLKPEREEAVARLSCVDDLQSQHLV